ncbi:MAG: hypothetical protein KBT50_05455 [Cycloclasticus sp.]|nr:hypothetical protein [Cycloclasticus sp.]MBQ0790049.1 hypothetical protein [Cycloclasticus sp.]
MKSSKNSAISYCELRTAKGNSIVIHDNRILSEQQGRIYLYNTTKNTLVQYDESIVSSKLFPLDEEQLAQAVKDYKSEWEAARKQYIREHTKPHHISSDVKQANIDELLSDDDSNMDDTDVDYDEDD